MDFGNFIGVFIYMFLVLMEFGLDYVEFESYGCDYVDLVILGVIGVFMLIGYFGSYIYVCVCVFMLIFGFWELCLF